jgi:hypothetical protein
MSAVEPPTTAPGRLRRLAGWSWPRAFPIVQFPNAPLATALAASLAGRLTEGAAQRSSRAIFYLALGVWAYEELRNGENWFRRLVGAGFSIYLIAELASALRSAGH